MSITTRTILITTTYGTIMAITIIAMYWDMLIPTTTTTTRVITQIISRGMTRMATNKAATEEMDLTTIIITPPLEITTGGTIS